MKRPILLAAALVCSLSTFARAQSPRISALFPAGAKVGETIEVAVRGGNLAGAKRVLVVGPDGVTAEIVGGNTTVDEATKPLFQKQCMACHEARSPANRALTVEQWAATVDRMIAARGAQINKDERDKIVGYLQALARAGQVSARVHVASNAVPGVREVRIVTDRGASSAFPFAVGALAEVTATEPNSKPNEAQKVTLPVVVNGALAKSGERDYFAFEAKKGEHLSFVLNGTRLNAANLGTFNPALYLYDAAGKRLAKNQGYFDLDPVLADWTAPEGGTYTLLVRDLLWRGSPASVYRLTMGALPPVESDATAVVWPAAARPGASLNATLLSSRQSVPLRVPAGADGLITVTTPAGEAPFLVRNLPDGGAPAGRNSGAVPLPALFNGRITQAGQTDTFRVQVKTGGTGLEIYARRLGSPLRAKVNVCDAKGNVLRSATAENDGDDVRLPDVFGNPGEYLIEVTTADGKAGDDYAYYLDASDAAGDFSLQTVGDNVSVGPGGAAALVVRASNRRALAGPITLYLRNLPDGISQVAPAVIPPDDDKAVVVLRARGDAFVEGKAVTVEGAADSIGGAVIARRARPFAVYQVNNQERTQPRASLVVAVAATPPDVVVSAASDTLRLSPGESVRVPVTLVRQNGFSGNVLVSAVGLPPGIELATAVNVNSNQTEATLTFRANNNARFLKEKRPFANLPAPRFAITATAGDMTYCTTPLAVVPGTTATEPK